SSPSPSGSACRCISSGWGRGSRTCSPSRHATSPALSPAWTASALACEIDSMTPRTHMNPGLKLLLELGPLLLFFIGNARWGIFTATAVFMVAVIAALIASYVLTRPLPIMTIISAVIVIVFGGLTLALQNDVFIK